MKLFRPLLTGNVILQTREKMKIIFALIILSILGYAFYRKKKKVILNSGLTGRVFSSTFTLSHNQPIDEAQTVELISINEDESATIRTLYSGDTLTAKPSEYFVGKDFGTFGLRLISISQERQEIQLKRSAPEHLG